MGSGIAGYIYGAANWQISNHTMWWNSPENTVATVKAGLDGMVEFGTLPMVAAGLMPAVADGAAGLEMTALASKAPKGVIAPEVPIDTFSSGENVTPTTLYHYTNEEGLDGILKSLQLNPSLKSTNPKDARYGDGQYLSNIVPGTKTPAQLSRAFLGIPYQGNKFSRYIEINVSGLDVIEGRTCVYLIPNQQPLDLTGRIVSYGEVSQ